MGSVVEREPVKCPTYFGQSHPTVASMATLPFASSAFLAYSTGTKSVISRGSHWKVVKEVRVDVVVA